MTTYTTYLRLAKPPFDTIPWDTAVNGNMDIIDAYLSQYIAVPGFTGIWVNSRGYTVGQVALDATNASQWYCAVSHTSAAVPTTFAQDRANNPTYWSGSSTTLGYLPIAGGTLTGPLTLHADPSYALDAATKQYVDYLATYIEGTFLPLAGGTLTGGLAAPYIASTGDLHANGNLYAGSSNQYILADNGSLRFIQFAPNWYLGWNTSGGQLTWIANGAAVFYIDGSGNASHSAGLYVAGGLTVNSNANITGQARISSIMNVSGIMYVADNPNYYYARSTSDGIWRWVENNNVTLQVDPAGNLRATGKISAAGDVNSDAGHFTIQGNPQYYMNYYGGYWNFVTNGAGVFSVDSTGTASLPNDLGLTWDLTVGGQGYKPGGGSWAASSDIRMKQDVEDYTGGLELIRQLNPKRYRYVKATGYDPLKQHVGLIGQDVIKVMPSVVVERDTSKMFHHLEEREDVLQFYKGLKSILTVDASEVMYALINAVKELDERTGGMH